MSEEDDDLSEKEIEKIRLVSKYWAKFYSKLDGLIDADKLNQLEQSNLGWSEHEIEFSKLREGAIKKHISSTHTWIKGKVHRYRGGYYESPLECAVCGLGASDYDYEKSHKHYEPEKITDGIPVIDMHNQLINRTCAEVMEAKNMARKAHKGGKCHQCDTFGCVWKR